MAYKLDPKTLENTLLLPLIIGKNKKTEPMATDDRGEHDFVHNILSLYADLEKLL